MEFRRINSLPPYVFATINELRDAGRQDGRDVIDLGFGNPDLPSPAVAVEKLAEAARNPRNHRYSASRGIPKIRQAITNLYLRKFEVELDPDTEVVTTIGAKEGLSHLMWVLVGPGDTALVPSPSYPIHIYAPLFAGADVRHVRLDAPGDGDRRQPGRGLLRQPDGGVGVGLAQAEGGGPVLPPQSDHRVRRPGLDDPPGRVRPRARHRARPRLRLRRHRLRRVHAPVHPAGARGQGCGRRAVHDDQVVLDGRMAGRASWSATRPSCRR